MTPPDCAPLITKDFDGWRVSVIRDGRVHVYTCETEGEARRFAELLRQPPEEPKNRKKPAAPPQREKPSAEERLSFLRLPPRWSNGR